MPLGFATNAFSMGVAWGDLDGDGDLVRQRSRYADLWVVPSLLPSLLVPRANPEVAGSIPQDVFIGNSGSNNEVYRNDGLGTLTAVAPGSIIEGQSANIYVADFDGDGLLDVMNGFVLHRNQGGGSYTAGSGSITVEAYNSRSIAIGDYDNDGDLDVLIGNLFNVNELHRNGAPATTAQPVFVCVRACACVCARVCACRPPLLRRHRVLHVSRWRRGFYLRYWPRQLPRFDGLRHLQVHRHGVLA